jgi:hypothetical protein
LIFAVQHLNGYRMLIIAGGYRIKRVRHMDTHNVLWRLPADKM